MRRSIIYCLLIISCCLLAVRFIIAWGSSFETAPDVSWAQPTDINLHNLGPAEPSRAEHRYDCTPLTYRMIDDKTKTMRSGCFITAAFGMFDPALSVVIFNNTDEAEYVKYNGQSAALSIMPYSGSVARFGGFPGQGSYMYLYTDFLGALETRGVPLVNRYKSITKNPNFTVTDSTGQPLSVNSQAMAYSARSQWMVTEVAGHALVRVNLTTFSIMPFAAPFDAPGLPFATHNAEIAVSEDGRYVAVASSEYRTFKLYDLKNCGAVTTSDPLVPQNCQSHDYWSYLEGQVGTTVSRFTHLNFVHDGLLSFDARTTDGTDSYLLAPDGPITSLIPYLGLGDSYASGQGAFNYLSGTDTTNNRCHVAARSYPLLLNQDLFGTQGHSVACSGARSHDIGSNSMGYSGQNKQQLTAQQQESSGGEVSILHDFTPGALAQQRFVTAYQPGAITLQVGGNDIGFSSLLLRCLSPLTSVWPPTLNANSCYQTYEDRLELVENINRSYATWVNLYRQIMRQSPQSRLYVIGYPHILSPNADCRANVRLTIAEINLAYEVTIYLNSVIQRAAEATGARYIDISDALRGHELCSGASGTLAVNGITAGNDAFGLGQESFHPNAFGHQLIEQAIMHKTNNFKLARGVANASAPAPTVDLTDPLLQAPHSGRTPRRIANLDITAGIINRGGVANIAINGGLAGTASSATYNVSIGSQSVGTLTSNPNGSIEGTVTVPTQTPAGIQVVTVSGPGQDDQPTAIEQITYIPANSTDSDGDGVTNDDDSCPLISNTGQDVNQNTIDDACDDQPPDPPPAVVPPTPTDGTPTSASGSSNQSSALVDLQAAQTPANELNAALLTRIVTSGGRRLAVVSPRASVMNAQILGVQSPKPQPVIATNSAQPKLGDLPRFYWYWWLLLAAALYTCWLYAKSRWQYKKTTVW